MVVRIVGTNAEEAGRAARGGPLRDGRVARRGGGQGRRRSPREPRREHPRRARDAARSSRASPAARASSTPGRCPSTAPGSSPASRRARAARPRSTARSRSSTRSPRRSARPAPNTSCIFVPAAGAPDAVMEAAGAGHRDDLLHHRGHPGARHDPGRRGGPAGRRAADRPELPGRDVAGPGQGRDHPGLGPSRGPGRRRQPRPGRSPTRPSRR